MRKGIAFASLFAVSLLLSVSAVSALEIGGDYHGKTPCEVSLANYHGKMDFFNPIRIPNEYCEEGAVRPRGISILKWDWWHNHIYS
jgi:hypothetical protein